jgi:hypothetical protein
VSSARWRTRTFAAALACALGAGGSLSACGGAAQPAAVEDRAGRETGRPVPAWFPRSFAPPPGSTVVDVIDRPEPGFGRTVTWRVPGRFDAVVDDVRKRLASLGWRPVRESTFSDPGTRRHSFFVESDEVYVVRVFEDELLEGLRLTVELPAR